MKKHRHIFANYIAKPRDPSKTHVKGYMSNPENVRYDEIVGFSVGLKSKDELAARIILDIDGQRVVKNAMNDNDDWTALMSYFMENYEQQIMDFLRKTGGGPVTR